MIFLDEASFLSKKTSDTIFVLGSGPSVSHVRDREWNIVAQYDSIAFNWFCMHKFEPTFYLIREQANLPQRKGQKESIKNFIRRLNLYRNTVGIISDVSRHTKRAYEYAKDDRIKMPCVVMQDDNSKSHASKLGKYMRRSPLTHGLLHGSCSLYNVLHLCVYLNYSRIIFIGVDLYNSQYFWLSPSETRHTVLKKGLNYRNRHAIADDVLILIDRFKAFRIPMFTTNPKSLLYKRISYKPISEFLK